MGLLPRMMDSQRSLEIMSNFADHAAAEDQRADDENRDWIPWPIHAGDVEKLAKQCFHFAFGNRSSFS
jgi:hypothetical protein